MYYTSPRKNVCEEARRFQQTLPITGSAFTISLYKPDWPINQRIFQQANHGAGTQGGGQEQGF